MKILSGHLTALDRRALRAMLDAGAHTARTPRRQYALGGLADGRAVFQVLWTERDDTGRAVKRTSRAEVRI